MAQTLRLKPPDISVQSQEIKITAITSKAQNISLECLFTSIIFAYSSVKYIMKHCVVSIMY